MLVHEPTSFRAFELLVQSSLLEHMTIQPRHILQRDVVEWVTKRAALSLACSQGQLLGALSSAVRAFYLLPCLLACC